MSLMPGRVSTIEGVQSLFGVQCLPERRFQTGGSACLRPSLHNETTASGAQLVREGLITYQAFDRLGERERLRRYQEPVDPVDNRLSYPTLGDAYHRQATRVGLERNESKRLELW